MKWRQRFSQPKACYWNDIIVAKYDAQNHWYPKRGSETTWCLGRETHYSLEDEFSQKVPFKAGNGLNVKFWHDL